MKVSPDGGGHMGTSDGKIVEKEIMLALTRVEIEIIHQFSIYFINF